jgi:hypothetical protein
LGNFSIFINLNCRFVQGYPSKLIEEQRIDHVDLLVNCLLISYKSNYSCL